MSVNGRGIGKWNEGNVVEECENDCRGARKKITTFKTLDNFFNGLCNKLGFVFSPVRTPWKMIKPLEIELLGFLITCKNEFFNIWSLGKLIWVKLCLEDWCVVPTNRCATPLRCVVPVDLPMQFLCFLCHASTQVCRANAQVHRASENPWNLLQLCPFSPQNAIFFLFSLSLAWNEVF